MGMEGIYTPYIDCLESITRIICKKHYKFVHVGKHKYLDKTAQDLVELFIHLSLGGLGGILVVCLSDEQQTDNSYK